MTNHFPSFLARLWLALAAAWRILFDRAAASRVRASLHGPLPAPADAALQLLGLLQREGRFVDFIQEDVSGFSDAEMGAAARVVHEGCHKALCEHFSIAPVRAEAEESRVTLDSGFDAGSVRLTGNVVGEPPFRGVLRHRGWRASDARLPKIAVGHDVRIIAPAEVEL